MIAAALASRHRCFSQMTFKNLKNNIKKLAAAETEHEEKPAAVESD